MIGVEPGNFVSRHQRQIDEVAVYRCQAQGLESENCLTVAAAKENKLDLIPLWEHGGVYEWQENRIISGYAKRWIKECPQLADRVLLRSQKQK